MSNGKRSTQFFQILCNPDAKVPLEGVTIEGRLSFTNAGRTGPWKGSSNLETETKNTTNKYDMKTTTVPGSSVDHTHNQNAACRRQVSACNFFSLNSGPGWQKRLIGSLGVLLGLAFAVLATREVKSDDNLQLDGYGLEGTWINTVNPILPPGVPPVTFRTYITFTGGGASIGSDPTRPLASPQHGTWVREGVGPDFWCLFREGVRPWVGLGEWCESGFSSAE